MGSSEEQREWVRRIRMAPARRVDIVLDILSRPVSDLCMLEQTELAMVAATLKAVAQRPDIIAAVANVAQAFELRDGGSKGHLYRLAAEAALVQLATARGAYRAQCLAEASELFGLAEDEGVRC